MAFVNSYYHNLDSKNRLFVPVRFRDQLGERFYIMPGPDNCLFVYPEATFEEIAEQYRKTHRDLDAQMVFYSNVKEATVDNQGRVSLDAEHVKHAELQKEVAVIGSGRRVVIKPLEKYRITQAETAKAIDFSEDIDW